MKVTIEATLEGRTTLDCSAEVETFADLARLAKKLESSVRGVKKILPDMANKKVEKVRIVAE